MGIVEDYINGLEGQENLELPEVVAEIARLHNEEISTSTAKIGQLQTQLSDKDAAIAERDKSISEVKAANWDLVNRLPGTNEKPEPQIDEVTGLPDSSSITLDDMFAQ
jgi:hypothetical protein